MTNGGWDGGFLELKLVYPGPKGFGTLHPEKFVKARSGRTVSLVLFANTLVWCSLWSPLFLAEY